MIDLTDMFCGCGGSSEGARKVAGVQVKYALNHWKLAVDSHNTNHPDTHHDCADISETHPARYDRTTGLIASPECTNHSLAKGQKRKNLHQQEIFQNKAFDASAVRSRATMWDVPRFAEQHRYEFVIVENVVDVRMWIMFDAWLSAMHALGYKHECVYLNAQFAHGEGITGFAPQSRDRIYIVFWKKGNRKPDLNIRPKAPCARCGTVEAVQSWKNGRRAGKYKTQYIYRCSVCAAEVMPFYYAALNALDLSIPMVRIGDRPQHKMKPLSANTMARIQYGLDKYGVRPTIIDQRNQSGSRSARIRSAEGDALNAQATGYSSYLFAPYLFNMSFSHSQADKTYSMERGTFPTQTTQESMAFVAPEAFVQANRNHNRAFDMTEPMPTVSGRNNSISFIVPHRKNTPAVGLEGILPTVTTLRNDMSFISASINARDIRDNVRNLRTDVFPTQTTTEKEALIVPIHGSARAKPATGVMDTVMTTGHSSLITMPYHGGSMQANRVDEPVSTIAGNDGLSLVDGRPDIMDCYFRMLQPSETALAQGFPMGYHILGNKSERQKQIGNANPPPTMELLVSRCVQSLL